MKIIEVLYLLLALVGCGAAFFGTVCFLNLLIFGEVSAAFKVLAIVSMDIMISAISAKSFISHI